MSPLLDIGFSRRYNYLKALLPGNVRYDLGNLAVVSIYRIFSDGQSNLAL